MAFFGLAGLALTAAAGCGSAPDDASVAPRSAAISTEVPLAAAEARACDVVLDVGNDPIANVRFPEGVAGSHFRRAPLLAVSLTSLADVALPVVPFTILAATAVTPHAVSVHCVDRLGHPIDGAALAGAALAKE
jgi:hypothetical protein